MLRYRLTSQAYHCTRGRRALHTTAAHMTTTHQPQVSHRVLATDEPVIVRTKALMAKHPGALSLAQGIVHWQPPAAAIQAAATAIQSNPAVNGYGPAEGLPVLREALKAKIAAQNGLKNYNVMITAGANQAFTNVVLTLVDEGDKVVLFKPYYFNHLMALQMSGGARNVVYGECEAHTLHPDLAWLEQELKGPQPPRMVVLVNPCNPTGVLLTPQEVARASELCAAAGAWLVLDNTYEDFLYDDGAVHASAAGPHVINLFSFSKAYGMMGWRVGYIAYPDLDGRNALGSQLLKVQDTIPICPTQLSQLVALEALTSGGPYVKEQVALLKSNRAAMLDALSPLGTLGNGIAGGEGAIYLWAKLPDAWRDDEEVVAWLVAKHGVAVIPGSSCGAPGYFRAAYANLKPDVFAQATARLKAGLTQLVTQGMV